MTDEIVAAQSVRRAVWDVLRSEAACGTIEQRIAQVEESDRWLVHLIGVLELDPEHLAPRERHLVAKLKELRGLLNLYVRHGRASVSSGELASTYREICQLLDGRYRARQLAKGGMRHG